MTITILFILVLGAPALQVSAAHRDADTAVVPPDRNSTEIAEAECTTETLEEPPLPVLSRKRRYVVFPKGTSIQFVACETLRIYVPLTDKFNIGITLGLAWMLPSEAHELYLSKRDVDSVTLASAAAGYGLRHRADMYKVLEAFLYIRGLKGRECIMRAVCEASESKQKETNSTSTSDDRRQGSFMEELHKLLFALPDHPKHKTVYDKAKQHAGKCGDSYSGCHSFLDLEI